MQTGTYESSRVGLGTKIKNAFKGLGKKRENEDEFESVTYGPDGKKI